ncbi:unnamed protein product [Staurois parvus]|uniref:Uncharacterized protein n=1 Tax=Staurois parvus TaxID=386267 RepID=A0ABN9B7Q8_9NEOB|nr:unnamed protein product [Staurois parvus]
MYTDHQGTDDQCALMISAAPAVPPVSVYQCLMSVLISAMYQCCLSVPISDACQCPSVPPTSASSSVQPISAHQCSLISAHQ